IQVAGSDSIKSRKIAIKHYFFTANQENESLNPLHRNQLCALIHCNLIVSKLEVPIWYLKYQFLKCQIGISSLQPVAAQVPTAHFTFNSRWMPNFSMRLRRVARVMPSSFAAWTWLLLASLSAWMTSSRSTAGI